MTDRSKSPDQIAAFWARQPDRKQEPVPRPPQPALLDASGHPAEPLPRTHPEDHE